MSARRRDWRKPRLHDDRDGMLFTRGAIFCTVYRRAAAIPRRLLKMDLYGDSANRWQGQKLSTPYSRCERTDWNRGNIACLFPTFVINNRQQRGVASARGGNAICSVRSPVPVPQLSNDRTIALGFLLSFNTPPISISIANRSAKLSGVFRARAPSSRAASHRITGPVLAVSSCSRWNRPWLEKTRAALSPQAG